VSVTTHRTPEQIGRTHQGPRQLPPLGHQRAPDFPAIVDTVLNNGLRVIAVRRSAVPMVEVRLWVPFADAAPAHAPTAELMVSSMLVGTTHRDRVRIDADLAKAGASLDASVDPERLSLAGNSLVGGMGTLVEVLVDLLTGATYPDAEVERERERLVERLIVARTQPRVIAREALQRHRYGDHPYTREVPEVDEVAAVEVAAVRGLHARSVLPKGALLVLVGDIEPGRAVETLAEGLAPWTRPETARLMEPLPVGTGADLLLVDRPGAVQSQIRLTAQGVPRTHERYPALQLANMCFGGYFSSRLVENIREDKGYTYSAHSGFEFVPGGATINIHADTASDVTAAAVHEIRYELGRLVTVPPTADEIDSARNYAIGSLMTATASQGGLAGTLTGLAAMGIEPDWLVRHPQRLRAVTTEQVAEAAREFFSPTAFTGVVVGDADGLTPALTSLGGVTVDGKTGL
jgi:predicted Zn-dependent peptidase